MNRRNLNFCLAELIKKNRFYRKSLILIACSFEIKPRIDKKIKVQTKNSIIGKNKLAA